MKILQSLLAAALFACAASTLAQQPAAVPDVPEIAPAPAAKEDCEKCKQGGMGRMAGGGMGGMQHGGMEGMACCKGKQERAGGKCDKCKEGGMGMMAHGDMGGMQHGGGGKGCCGGMGGMQHGRSGGMACCGGMGGGDSAALERRIAELEKRLDLMQQLLAQPRKR
ncbi:MAG: hypothetical protein AB1720_07575 [Pseudomonadota bacterium]